MSGGLALFDLDGTLLTGDTDQLWCEFLVEAGVLDRSTFAAANDDVARRYARGTITPAEYCAFYAATLAGRSAEGWSPLRARFVREVVGPRIAAAARALVESHRAAGDRLVLTTATNRFLADPIADSLGIGALIATELEIDDEGSFTGRNVGDLNMGGGKVGRLAAWLAAARLPDSIAAEATFYSDSGNDLPLLRAVARAVAVDPDERLRAEATRRGWPILQLAR